MHNQSLPPPPALQPWSFALVRIFVLLIDLNLHGNLIVGM